MRPALRPFLPVVLTAALLIGLEAGPAEAAPAATGHSVVVAARKSLHLAKPKIVGQHVVGAILIARVAKPSGSRLHYQWRSNGHAVARATHSFFKIRRADKGHRISVTVTATKRHLKTVARTSGTVRITVPNTTPPPPAPPVSTPPAPPAPPAAGPVTYTSANAPIGREPSIDTHNGTVYSLSDGVTTDGEPTIALIAVDAGSNRIVRSTNLVTFYDQDSVTLWDRDVRVDNRSHTVWVLLGGPYGSYVEALNGADLTVKQQWYVDGDAGTLAVNPATGIAYTASDYGFYSSSDTDTVQSFDPSTGGSTSVIMPTDQGYVGAPNVAFDSNNNGVYVAFDGRLYAYSQHLSLASTLTLPSSEQGYSLGVTADGDTHTLYVTGTQLYEVAGSSNTISRTAPISSVGRVPVIDPRANTLYVGTGVYDTGSLGRVGTLPGAAESVDGGSHTIYSKGMVITRHQ